MSFKVAARTILELGAELISSDAVAIYELVKNSVDAGSKDGIELNFCIVFQHADFVDSMAKIEQLTERWTKAKTPGDDLKAALEGIKTGIAERVLASAPKAARETFLAGVTSAQSPAKLEACLKKGYEQANSIEFRDTGCGMAWDDLIGAYLVIGTPSRRRHVDQALAEGKVRSPYLGEKGVGRLSAMRLGWKLYIETATAGDKRLNCLDVDWSLFNDLNKLVGDIELTPVVGEPKSDSTWSGTRIVIKGLTANWSLRRMKEIATFEIARLTDPFSKQKRRFRIAINFNGERIDIPRLDQAILNLAQARVSGSYDVIEGKAALNFVMSCSDLGKGNPPSNKRVFLENVDIRSLTKDSSSDVSTAALASVGNFNFDLYWYNRRLLRGVDSIGERKRVLELQSQWSGIMLFRDEYRVFPYGDDEDDWLGLDRRALASPGYKLNKAQFIGRVGITRMGNPFLIDQTNREGLKDCDEKAILVEIMRFVVQDRLREFLDDVDKSHKKIEVDFSSAESRLEELDARAKISLKALEKRHVEEKPQVQELLALFEEMKEYFGAAKLKAEQIEDERDRMIQLAGVGLMLEIVAHELARSTEHALKMLDEATAKSLPASIEGLFSSLRSEMKTMNKRLRVLDPLSISGRQRKERFNLTELVQEVVDGHKQQFGRHSVSVKIVGEQKVDLLGVRGMFVQIVENLIQNSIYWMDLRRLDEQDYRPTIEIKLAQSPTVMEYTDNGPGIQPSLADEIFKAFFSTKGKSRRQGLGLYIARDCAKHHGGHLYLSDERAVHKGRLNTFVLEIPKG